MIWKQSQWRRFGEAKKIIIRISKESINLNKVSQRLVVTIELISIYVFGCPEVSFFQYFMGCLTMFGFINTLNNKKQNIEFGMKKIIAWWTGATSDWSGAIITNWMISICEHNDSCSQVRILPVHMF